MNQDQVKEKLLKLQNPERDFKVIFSGKQSKKVNGVYYPESCEIIIHNGNFTNDNALMYTAIHEFAHHLHHCESALPISSRSHTNRFFSIFHKLLFRAEEMDLYRNIFETDPEFVALTERIRRDFLYENGRLIREFGKLLLDVQSLCMKHGVQFMDYLDRVLRIPRESAKSMMKAHLYEIEPELGYDNMKTLASISDPQKRVQAQEEFMGGCTPAMIKDQFKARQKAESEIELLQEEKQSIESRIARLTDRLKEIENRLQDAEFRSVARL